jgi:type I restriction enzyme, S subunit
MAATNQVMLSEAVYNNRFSAEFFDPQYIFKPAESSTWLPIGRILKKCEYGLSISMNIEGSGYPIFRMNEIDNCFAQRPDKYAVIPKFIFEQYRLIEKDILFNRTNSFEFVGRTGIVKGQTDCTFASYLIRLVPDPNIVLPEFLTVYLNTQFGIGQIKRRAMRSINQANVSGAEVKRILIPIIDLEEQQKVANVLNEAFYAIRKSERLYTEAQHLLESELGLDKLHFQKPVGYTARFSELEQSHRSDAQHYQPQFAQLLSHLAAFSPKRIRDIRTFNRRGLQPIYVENGPIDVVNSQHLGPQHTDYDGLQKTSEKAFSASTEGHIQNNDLLIYTTGAYIGRTNVYLRNAPALASNHVNILRLNPGIDSAYMALVFQSVVGQFQTQKHARGSAQAELYPPDIDRFIVPLLDPTKQIAIGDLVRKSLEKQQESKRLLDQAKTRVEQFIEEAVRS